MPWICRLLIPAKTAGEIVVHFYQIAGYSAVFCHDILRYLNYREMQDFNMAESQQIKSKLKKCSILAVY